MSRKWIKRSLLWFVVGTAYVGIVFGSWQYINPTSSADRGEWVRTAAQIAGAVFLGVGIIYTHRTVDTARKTFAITQRKQDAEQFFAATDKLTSPAAAQRNAALFALRSLARDAPLERGAIVEVVSSFAYVLAASHADLDTDQAVEPSVETAVSVLASAIEFMDEDEAQNDFDDGLRARSAPFRTITLQFGNYNTLRIFGGSLDAVSFHGSWLKHAVLALIKLDRAHFDKAHLQGAGFMWSSLRGASFSGADLSGATFLYVNPERLAHRPDMARGAESWRVTTSLIGDIDNPHEKHEPKWFFELTDFGEATLDGAKFPYCDLSLARNLTWEQLRTADLEGTVLPTYLTDDPPDWYTTLDVDA